MNRKDRSSDTQDNVFPVRNDVDCVPDEPPGSQKPQTVEETGPRVVQSNEILQGASEVLILHDGQTYRLRRTKNGKLILNK